MLRLLVAAKFAAACLVGAFLITAAPSQASAESCSTTTYSGCSTCSGPGGSTFMCWSNEPTAFPQGFAPFGVCRADNALPGTTTTINSPPDPPGQRNVYRFYLSGNTDHFLTLSFCEVGFSNYERVAFTVLISPPDANYRLIYRCRVSSADHFVSTDPGCEGRNFEGAYGYVSTIPRAGYVPIYRFYKNSITDHLTTTDYQEGITNGYTDEGIQGYVPQ